MNDQAPSIVSIPPPSLPRSSATRPATILAWSLAIVLFYFGLNEVLSPQDWITFAPAFLGTGSLAISLVILHGILLSTTGVALVINYYRKATSVVVALLLLEILANLIMQSGFSDIVIRDIGILGAAIALFFMPS